MTRNIAQNTRPSFRFSGEGSGDETTQSHEDDFSLLASVQNKYCNHILRIQHSCTTKTSCTRSDCTGLSQLTSVRINIFMTLISVFIAEVSHHKTHKCLVQLVAYKAQCRGGFALGATLRNCYRRKFNFWKAQLFEPIPVTSLN